MLNVLSDTSAKKIGDWKHLLGKTFEEILPLTGEPFASYFFHQEEVYLYDSGGISTIVLRNGRVVRCDESADTRRAIRITPTDTIPALITGSKKVRGYMKNISIAGTAFHHSNKSIFSIGSRLVISFALPIEGISRFLEIPCRIHETRSMAWESSTICLFDHTDTPWKKRILSRYVELSTIQTRLGLKNPYSKRFSILPK
ncbi:PilZ domain-containing protein [bacterium]|nr:PilZ domain-containing protein [bacterium]